jgi:hypothetical protein
MHSLILQGVGDEEIAVDVLDAEGREPSRNLRIRKGAVDLAKRKTP